MAGEMSEIEQSGAAVVPSPRNRTKSFPKPESPTLVTDILREAGRAALEQIPAVGPVLAAANRVREQRAADRQMKYVVELAERSDERIEDLLRRIEDDEDLSNLFWSGWQAAADARTAEKIKMLASVVGSSSQDEHRVSEGHIILRVVRNLEPEHVAALSAIQQAAAQLPPTLGNGETGRAGADPSVLRNSLDYRDEVVGLILNDLEAMGVIRNAWAGTWCEMDGNVSMIPTDLGVEILTFLQSLDDDC